MTLNLPNTLFSVVFLAVSIAYLTVIAMHGAPLAPNTASQHAPQHTASKPFPPHQRGGILADNSAVDRTAPATIAENSGIQPNASALRAARETARRYAATSDDFQSLPAPKSSVTPAANQYAAIAPRPKPALTAEAPAAKPAPDNTDWENTTVASINPAPERITTPRTPPLTDQLANTRPPRQTWIWKLAHQDYCERNPSDCGRFEPAPLIDWQENKTLIDDTWRTVYESFWPTDDVGGDTWGIGQDCEDYALKLRSELARTGIPRYHLLMATGRALDSSQKLHAVLIIRTDEGWKIADSLHANILDRPSADRVFDCQYMEDPDRGIWASCDGSATPIYAGF